MVERKYLAHFVDTSFAGGSTVQNWSPNWKRLGQDLEEYNEELNPQVEVKKNIIGEQSVTHSGYEVQSEVEPYYLAEKTDPLGVKLLDIINNRKTGGACKTAVATALLSLGANDAITVDWCYVEDAYVIPSSLGGDTSGVQIPFTIYHAGNRRAMTGDYNSTTKVFTTTAISP